MIISELKSGLDLVVKFTDFATQLQDGWYKGSAEVNAFRDNVWILSAKDAQFRNQLHRFGISEDDHLLRLLKAANEALEKELQYVHKLQNSRFLRWKKKVFPTQLLYVLGKLVEIVDAGPQLLAIRVDNHDLLEKNLAQTPALLPFGPDSNYVPIVGSIQKVQSALENREGPRVVTVHGGPGIGKSSLVKYVALHYQEQKQQARNTLLSSSSKPIAHFPDGVHYLFCGQKAQDKVKQLQLELLRSLGFGARCAALQSDGPTAADAVQEGEYLALPSLKMKLSSCLAKQNLLIVVDDVWEEKALQELLVPAEGVKYLVTSQIREIWGSAQKIHLEGPEQNEARQIMANYTDGLPVKGEFPENLQRITDDIITAVEYHPLSLANIGISVNRIWATDPSQWRLIKDHINVHLDENDFRTPLAYDTPYNLAISASMMLMVESLPSESQRLLCLLALFEGGSFPEYLVKFFFKFVEPNDFALKLTSQQKFLEDRSLIESRIERDRRVLETHGLRMYYIRKRKTVDMRSIACKMLSMPMDQDATKRIRRGDADETLVAVLSAMHFDQFFKDAVASNLENHIKILNGGVIPRSLNMSLDTRDIVELTRHREHETRAFVELLNADYGEPDWKHRAREYAKKIIIKFICQGKLDDHSMAQLLQLSQTASAACEGLLRLVNYCHGRDYRDHNVTFSSAHGKTMNALLDLFHNDAATTEQRAAVISVLHDVLSYEGESTICTKCAKLVDVDSDSSVQKVILQTVTLDFYYYRTIEVILKMAEVPSLLKDLIMSLFSARGHNLNSNIDSFIGQSMLSFSNYRRSALQISEIPGVLQLLVNCFISDAVQQEYAGKILSRLSLFKEIRLKLGANEPIWKGLVDILAKMEGQWQREAWSRWELEERAHSALTILCNLALEEDLRETRPSLSCIHDRLLFLQLVQMSRHTTLRLNWCEEYSSTRALAVLYSDRSKPRPADFLSLQDWCIKLPSDEFPTSKATMISAVVDRCYVSLYWTRVQLYARMKSYSEALTNLDLAHHHLSLIMKLKRRDSSYQVFDTKHGIWLSSWPAPLVLRDCRIYLQAMLEDYGNALVSATERLADKGYGPQPGAALAELGVLKRLSGDLQGALDNLNASADLFAEMKCTALFKSEVLKHRGYVKFLMDDKTGAKEDADAAKKLMELHLNLEKGGDDPTRQFWTLRNLQVNYLGFTIDGYETDYACILLDETRRFHNYVISRLVDRIGYRK
ncbi:unnamed protein product [Calypogeia fissa]